MALQETTSDFRTLISDATIRNWRRLSVSAEYKLLSRANKKLSKKIIIPSEYFCNIKNIPVVEKLIDYVSQQNYSKENIIYSFAINLLSAQNILFDDHVQKVLNEYSFHYYHDLIKLDLPKDESDFLGIIYQGLLSEGEKNTMGAYYTSNQITSEMTSKLDFSNGQTFFDPCCGSGAFILALQNTNPSQIFAIDNNPLAVFMTKINLLLKFKHCKFYPQVWCCDYLNENEVEDLNIYFEKKYDYIITNPPWGVGFVKYKNEIITSNERFSLFFVKAYKQLKDFGIIRFLLPESILNVKIHKDIRRFILENGNLQQITFYTQMFNGVTTKVIDISQQKNTQSSYVTIKNGDCISTIAISAFYQTKNNVFSMLDEKALKIIEKIKDAGMYYLNKSVWALGIVTGNNKTKLQKESQAGFEAIYTGKEISPYKLKRAQNYILYNKKALQQVAKEEYYRAKEKLVYKFISKKLIFAYDDTKSLFLNSANILIPDIPNMSIKTVLAFLNSEIYQWLYSILFSEIKVLKGNLMELAFPQITKEQDDTISFYVQQILNGEDGFIEQIETEIYKIFKLTVEHQKYIKEFLSGTFNK